MTTSLAFNPYVSTNAAGSFNVQSTGYIQGQALNDPAIRNELAGGILAASETIPMWGGVGVYELIGGTTNVNADIVLGSTLGRATSVTAQAAKQLTGFSVFDQNHSMINSPQSPVPAVGSGGQVNFYRLGSGARISVAVDPALISLQGSIVTSLVSWDYSSQALVPYAPAYTAVTITGATWAGTAGGQATYTVGTDLTAVLSAGSNIDVTGVVSTGGTGLGYNGHFVVVSVTSTTVVVSLPAASTPGTYASGGTIAAGGGALPVEVLNFNVGNSMTVIFNPVTGFINWNRSGSTAIIKL